MIEASIKENILLGAPEDEPQLRRILKACSLWDEFTVLPGSLDYNVGYEGEIFLVDRDSDSPLLVCCTILINTICLYLIVSCMGVNNELSMELFATLRELLSEKTVLLVTNDRNIIEQCDLKITISSEQSGYSIERIGEGKRIYSISSAEEPESEELEGQELEEKELERQELDKRESSKQKFGKGGSEDEIFEDFYQSNDTKHSWKSYRNLPFIP